MNGDFSQKLNQVLSNPAMMAQIKALADTMTENNQTSSETKPEKESDFSYRETTAEPISEKPFVPPFPYPTRRKSRSKPIPPTNCLPCFPHLPKQAATVCHSVCRQQMMSNCNF